MGAARVLNTRLSSPSLLAARRSKRSQNPRFGCVDLPRLPPPQV